MKRLTGTLYDDQYIFIISHTALLIMRNVSDKNCGEIQITFYVQIFFFSKIVPVMWYCKNKKIL